MVFQRRKLNQKGYTLIEMAMATVILGVMATTVILSNRYLNEQVVKNSDQVFATEKAIQMYEELRALVNGNEQSGVAVLDDYSNGSAYDLVLTTDKAVDTGLANANPGDSVSGNVKSSGYWRYMRQVLVNKVANDAYARQVTVKVYLYPGNAAANNQTKPGLLLATVGGILRTSSTTFQPSQVMDVYIIQIDNIPAWWAVMPSISSSMQSVVSDIQTRNQGLVIRPHYITRTTYGRDPYYKPYSNYASTSGSAPMSWVYFYPGNVPQDSNTSGLYYDSTSDQNSLMLDGNINVDGTSYPVSTSQFQGDPNAANISYSLADQYNNGMRYPDEMATYAAVTQAAVAAAADGVSINEGVTEISERMLFENMLSQPASFANSLIINLHGEMMPLPPIRNYSDAAKDPGNQMSALPMTNGVAVTCAITSPTTGNTNVRVVTHPELLYYPVSVAGATAVTVRLRVYAYYDSADENTVLPSGDPRVPAISLFFPDSSVTVMAVTAICGSSTTRYSYQVPSNTSYSTPPSSYAGTITGDTGGGPMSMSVSYLGPSQQTLITLFNTPLRCPINTSAPATGGLNPGDMLYQQEYIPCSPDQATTFSISNASYLNNTYSFTGQDLTMPTTATGNPKNTARWIISVAMPVSMPVSNIMTIYSGTYAIGATISGCHAIETRLGNGVTSSTYKNSSNVSVTIPPNLSRTYVWCGDNSIPPYTEQYQFLGDPRDCPYLDTKIGGITIAGAGITIAPYSYNWWFKSGKSTVQMAKDGYAGFGASGVTTPYQGENWVNHDNIMIDIPRYYQIIRQGLINSTSVLTNTNGWNWFYFAIGGEVGFNQSPMSSGVTLVKSPFLNATSATPGNVSVDNIVGTVTGSGVTGTWVAANISSTSNWYQRSWLGEIYPDASYMNSWVPYGNLPTVANTSSLPETFYLQSMSTVPTPSAGTTFSGGGGQSNDGFQGLAYWNSPGDIGCSSFFNGHTSAGSTIVLNHTSNDNTGLEENLAVTTYSIYQYSLPYDVDVQRGWYFANFAYNTPSEWNSYPYNTSSYRPVLDIPSTETYGSSVSSRVFYGVEGASATSFSATMFGSALVRMTETTAAATQVGYVIETGLAPSGNVGFAGLAEADLVDTLRTFLDGGQLASPGSPGHIMQIPLVKIFPNNPTPEYIDSASIALTVASPVTYTSSAAGMTVGAPVTDIWWRFEGATSNLANYYTEEYPGYANGLPSSQVASNAYTETGPVVYNLKYSTNTGRTWNFVQDNAPATFGVCDYGSTHVITTSAPWTYSWGVSTGSFQLAQGDCWLMVEAYRQGYLNHYCYDIYDFSVNW